MHKDECIWRVKRGVKIRPIDLAYGAKMGGQGRPLVEPVACCGTKVKCYIPVQNRFAWFSWSQLERR